MTYSQSYLAHGRTKGSRNGERKYQLEDGTWTEEGLARRREMYQKQKQGIDAKIGETKKSILQSKGGFTFLGRLKDEKINDERIAKAKEEVKNISDEDLQKINRRMNLEKNYIDLKAPPSHKNEQLVKDIFDTAAAIGGVAATAVGIVFAIKNYKLTIAGAKMAAKAVASGLGSNWDA